MNYTKTEWKDLPDTSTPITSSRLNNMEDGIEYLFEHGVGGDTLPIGMVIPFTGENIPDGYMLCDGSAISRTTYATLFSVIGTTFGTGDGETTFNIPNLKGRVVIGKDSNDTDFDSVGETGGEKEHTLTVSEIPSHNHNLNINLTSCGQVGGSGYGVYGTAGSNSEIISSTGSGQSHNNLQPYLVVNYIIKVLNSQNGEVRSESLPVGSEIEFDGTVQDIPVGWVQVSDKEKILWTNSDPTQAITEATNITLSSSDYDVLEIFFNQRSFNNPANYSIKFLKNSTGTRCYIPSTDGNIYRTITKNNDTSLTISTIIGSTNNDNTLVIPIYVVGYKTGLFS